MDNTSILSTLINSVIGMAVVFAVLIILMVLISLMSKLMKKNTETVAETVAPAAAPAATAPGSCGEVKIYDVPDKTAAQLMAITADKLDAPLNTLRFISIKEVK